MSSLDSYKGLLAAGLLGGIAGGAVVASLMQKCVYFNKKKIGLQLSHLQSSNFHLYPPLFYFKGQRRSPQGSALKRSDQVGLSFMMASCTLVGRWETFLTLKPRILQPRPSKRFKSTNTMP